MSNLFTTHDVTTLRANAGQVVVMHAGKAIEQGSKTHASPPREDYPKLLLSFVPGCILAGWARRSARGRCCNDTVSLFGNSRSEGTHTGS